MKQRERGDDRVVRRYTFKVYHSDVQFAALDKVRRMHCTLYNAANQQRGDAYRLAGETLTHYGQAKDIKHIRADDPDYAAISADSLSFTLARLDRAYKAFFRRAKAGHGAASGYPRFKRSDDYPGFTHRPGQGLSFNFRPGAKSGAIEIKGVPGRLKIRGRFPIPPLSVRTCDMKFEGGDWWASVVVELPPRMPADNSYSGEVRFDLVDSFARVRRVISGHAAGPDDAAITAAKGRTSFGSGLGGLACVLPFRGGGEGLATDEEGEKKAQPFNRGEAVGTAPPSEDVGSTPIGKAVGTTPASEDVGEVAHLQQRMALLKRGSCRYRRLRKRKARREARTARQRREALHVWSTRIARDYETLTIIKPEIKEATASGSGDMYEWGAANAIKAKLNRHVLDQAPATAIAMLEYKVAERRGSTTCIIDQQAPVLVGNLIVEATKATRKLRKAVNARGPAGRDRDRQKSA